MKNKTYLLSAFIFLNSVANATPSKDEQHILKQINHFRMTHFLMPLKFDEHLNKIAMQHSQNMASHRIGVGHQGFENRFKAMRTEVENVGQAAENVAAGYKNVDMVIDGWIHSPGHRQNILGHYNLTGIAIAYDGNHKPYYTQVFAKQIHLRRGAHLA
jgi:uncharacterized protein YkwD